VDRSEETIEESLEELLEGEGFLPRTSGLLEGTRPVWMSIPTSVSVDIVGKAVLRDEAMVEMLKVVEEKDNLFTDSPIGTTMQDGGKRKRSDLERKK